VATEPAATVQAPALPKLLLTQRQAAEACSLCGKSLYLAVKRGELRAVKIGRAVRYDPRDLAEWIDRMKGGVGHE
jgi:predicted DNA-binding transcriptional regulator AlpA